MMRRLILLFALGAGVLASGCAEMQRHALGARVHAFNLKGVDYVHCSVVADKAQPELARDALKVCEDGILGPVERKGKNP